MIPHTINIYSGGSYNEIHDCENVYLSCEKAEIRVDKKPMLRTSAPDANPDEPAPIALPDVNSDELAPIALPDANSDEPAPIALPDVLRTPEAEALLEKLSEAGVLDAQWQPVGLSNAEKGTLVEYMSDQLGIRNKWQIFGGLWGVHSETLRTSKARGLIQQKTWDFRERLDAL